jgi:hypothetical protein
MFEFMLIVPFIWPAWYIAYQIGRIADALQEIVDA